MENGPRKADYGIDAPGVIRNLAVAGAVLLVLAAAALLGALPKEFVLQPTSQVTIRFPAAASASWAGIGFSAAACWMYLGARFGKIHERDRILDRIEWRGDERVLDVGCGRGLLLVGAARRVKSGSAVGIDLWQEEDLTGNRADVPLKNAEVEGVAGRVSVQTADMRRLPFEDGSFDVVVSKAAIHNLYRAEDRATAIREIARVLKPGGRAVISDIRHFREYARTFAETGCRDVRLVESRVLSALSALVTMGKLRPNTLLVRKAAA